MQQEPTPAQKPSKTWKQRWEELSKIPFTPKMAMVMALIVFVFWGWAANDIFKDDAKSEVEHLSDQVAGPDNVIVQRINSLNSANAYQVGYSDGLQDFSKGVRILMPANPSGYRADLKDVGEGKNTMFDLIGEKSDMNHVDSTVLEEYRNGWNRGWSQGMAAPYH